MNGILLDFSKETDIPHWHAPSTSKRCISEENAVYLHVNVAGVIQW
jgi:hypothetical protein